MGIDSVHATVTRRASLHSNCPSVVLESPHTHGAALNIDVCTSVETAQTAQFAGLDKPQGFALAAMHMSY